MSVNDTHWTTAITQIEPNEVRLRGYRIEDLMGRISFAGAIYLALTGTPPPEGAIPLLDAILVSSIDHGATPPSTLAARTAASTGAPLNAAIAAGILSINRYHGGAIEDAMRLILEIVHAADDPAALEQEAAALAGAYRQSRRRIPGLGHRIHSADPRAARLFALTEEAGIAAGGVRAMRAIAAAFAQQARRALPVNVDGAIAAVLVDLGLAPELANAFFIMARVPGLVAHIHEEATRERPVRPIHPIDHDYDGPPPRDWPPGEQP